MPILKDARGNEFDGSIDQITGGSVTDARTITATLGALNAESAMDLNGQCEAVFDLRTAAASLTLVFEATVDNVNYFGLPGFDNQTETYLSAVVITTTLAKTYIVGCHGYRRIRVRVSAYTSGNITAALRATQADAIIYARPMPSSLLVTATAAVNTGATATLPAGGAGLFHYVTKIELVKLYAVQGVANAAGVIITSTNLPGTPSWTTEQAAGALGTAPVVINWLLDNAPLKSSVANTATTFVAGAQLQTIWRWNVAYYVGA